MSAQALPPCKRVTTPSASPRRGKKKGEGSGTRRKRKGMQKEAPESVGQRALSVVFRGVEKQISDGLDADVRTLIKKLETTKKVPLEGRT